MAHILAQGELGDAKGETNCWNYYFLPHFVHTKATMWVAKKSGNNSKNRRHSSNETEKEKGSGHTYNKHLLSDIQSYLTWYWKNG